MIILSLNWSLVRFRSAFSKANTVLLFHLKNHYALIFAVREWVCIDNEMENSDDIISHHKNEINNENENDDNDIGNYEGKKTENIMKKVLKIESKKELKLCVKRQILTARRGQRPTVWIDFNEVRETILNWEGYKIISISYSSQSSEECSLHSFQAINSARIIIPEEYKK